MFPIENGLKQGDALSPLFFNFALDQVGLKLNGTHQLQAFADDVNLLGNNVDTIQKNREILIDTSKEVGPRINIEKPKYVFLSHNKNEG
jgi:hypothetical protein